ncbi:transposon ty3-g Gag-Pol polyprotein, partial [Plakobranchus ocellatus]
MFSRFGTPSVLKTDNGAPFNGKEFSIFAQKYGFKHSKITPLWPEANGEAERFVRSLNKFVHTCQAEHSEWKEQLPNFLYLYRATPHSSTKLSPHEALTGRKMKTSFPEIIHQRNKPLQTIEDNDLSAKERQKYHADKKRSNLDHKIQKGDTVLVHQQKQNKLTPPYNPAPYIVTDVRGSMVTAAKGGHSITRNSSFFKTVPAQDSLSQLAYPEAESRHRSHSHPDELDTPV